MPARILLADDHPIVRQGVRALLERADFVVVAECGDGQDAVRLAKELSPDVAVIDLEMPVLNGLEAARAIQQCAPRTKTILLTMHTRDQYILQAVRAGFRGCVLKTDALEELIRAIDEVVRGGMYLSPSMSRTVVEAYLAKTDLPADPLTPRERQVCSWSPKARRRKKSLTS